MSMKIIIYPAKKIITMNPTIPEASAVAVRNGRILGVGTPEELKKWGKAHTDETFKDRILIPGLIEAHCHAATGSFWSFPYIGYFDRYGPDRKLWKACRSFEEIIDRLTEIDKSISNPDETLIAWGLDPIYFEGDRLVAAHLDQVSKTRPIFICHTSGHLATVNTALMMKQGIDASTDTIGVSKGPDGKPNGELQEFSGMGLAGDNIVRLLADNLNPEVWEIFGQMAQNAGCTTVTDLGFFNLNKQAVGFLRSVIDDPNYPVRVSIPSMVLWPDDLKQLAEYLPGLADMDLETSAEFVAGLQEQGSDKLHLGQVKTLLDGSIQGFTARLRPPGYLGRDCTGIWITSPDVYKELLMPFQKWGLSVHCHCNGDEAVDVFLDSVEQAQATYPWPDSRHVIQHCQLATIDQYRRMASLGISANIFSNHIYYWGDQHYDNILGADRAKRMEACTTAKKCGVPFSLHCDSPITPLGSLHTAWCAVNRLTASNRTLGDYEKISVSDALRAVTLDAAYTLKLDHLIGSIEPGKFADFTVLEEDPLEIDPIRLKDIKVLGTVLGGKHFLNH